MDNSVKCDSCGLPINKKQSEINRTDQNFCSKSCWADLMAKNRFGEGVGFGYYTNDCRKRANRKDLSYDLTSIYLKQLYDEQQGKCAISGIAMTLGRKRKQNVKSLKNASVDRIDNSKGYVKGNVQFVCLGINYMRNSFSIEEATLFIKDIKAQ